MDYKQIIAESWVLTKQSKRLIIWYGFIPSLLTTLVGIFYMGYQIISTYRSQLFSATPHSFLGELFNSIFDFIRSDPSTGLTFLGIVIVIVIAYLLLPTVFRAGLIELTARATNGQEVTVRQGISYGLLRFLPLLEYHLLIKGFGFFTFLAEAAFVGRNLGWEALKLFLIPFLLFMIVGFFLVLLFTYSDYFIVIDKEPIFSAMRKSGAMVIKHFTETFLIGVLMLIITIRIVINIILVLLIPALIIVPAGYIATITFAQIGYVIGAVIGLVALFFAAYLGGILEVFATFVWVKTFLKLTNKEEQDVRDTVDIETDKV